ncbi:MAG: 1-acyl-sn-glycerol-3-phosphate acyltransferase [Firmicutes bacterium]|nr:1-acyl-sn-glycerol-3-phosphate acyltransferase [Bacillota bacterium]
MKKILRAFLVFLVFVPTKIIFPVKVYGKNNLPKKQTYVAISNHMHWLDIFYIWFYLPKFSCFLAKKEFKKKPLTSLILRILGAIFIDRQKPDLKAVKQSVKALKKSSLVIFPEGTRNKNDENLQSIKGGAAMIAAKADTQIVPIVIGHRPKAFKKNFIYISAPVFLPVTSADRFNSDALKICTDILSVEMTYAKDCAEKIKVNKMTDLKKQQMLTESLSG